jgi:hypothetical protein
MRILSDCHAPLQPTHCGRWDGTGSTSVRVSQHPEHVCPETAVLACAYTSRAATGQAKPGPVLKLHAKGLSKAEIAKACEIGIASVYRVLDTAAAVA